MQFDLKMAVHTMGYAINTLRGSSCGKHEDKQQINQTTVCHILCQAEILV